MIFHENKSCNTQVFDMWCLIDVLALGHSISLCPLFPQYCTMSSDQHAEQQPKFETIAVLDFGSGTLDTAFSSRLLAIRWFKRWMTTLDSSLQRNLQFKTLSLEKNGWSLKVRLHHMKASDLEMAVEAFSQLTGRGGSVEIMSDESVANELLRTEIFKQKKNKQAGDCGDFGKTAAVVDRLSH